MTTKELIDAAIAAQNTRTAAAESLSQAQSVDATAAENLAAANKSVHDDLASAQALYITADVPPKYLVASATDPDSYTLTEIRVA